MLHTRILYICCQAARLDQHHRLGGCHIQDREDLLPVTQLFTNRYSTCRLLASLTPESPQNFFQRLPLSLASPKCQICPKQEAVVVSNRDFRPSHSGQQGKNPQQAVPEDYNYGSCSRIKPVKPLPAPWHPQRSGRGLMRLICQCLRPAT